MRGSEQVRMDVSCETSEQCPTLVPVLFISPTPPMQVVQRDHYLSFMEWFVYTHQDVALPVKVREVTDPAQAVYIYVYLLIFIEFFMPSMPCLLSGGGLGKAGEVKGGTGRGGVGEGGGGGGSDS